MTSEKVLVDTNIFMDYYFNRKSGLLPIGEFAFNFVRDAIGGKFFVIVIIESVKEITNLLNISENEVYNRIFLTLIEKNKIEIIYPSDLQKAEANSLGKSRNLPYCDALIA